MLLISLISFLIRRWDCILYYALFLSRLCHLSGVLHILNQGGEFMISAVFGLPGSGKSLILSYMAYRATHGKSINFHGFHVSNFKYARVYTNFPCEGAYKLDFDTLGNVKYEHCLMLCDEIQLFADSRNFKTFGDNLKYFFSMHRHDHIDFVYASQSFDNVDKRIRSLTDRLYYVDPWLFNTIRVREILSFFDVSRGSISEGYEYAKGFNTKYFRANRLYKYNDTYAKIKEVPLRSAPAIPWVKEEPKELGDIIHEGKIKTILSNGDIVEAVASAETAKPSAVHGST